MVGRRGSGSLEAEVVACLAAARTELTVAQVRERLGQELAYTTVLTTLVRLFDKGALRRVPRGRAFAYALDGGQSGAAAAVAAQRMQRVLSTVDNRAGVLSRFVDGLDPESEKVLRRLLDEHARADDDAARP